MRQRCAAALRVRPGGPALRTAAGSALRPWSTRPTGFPLPPLATRPHNATTVLRQWPSRPRRFLTTSATPPPPPATVRPLIYFYLFIHLFIMLFIYCALTLLGGGVAYGRGVRGRCWRPRPGPASSWALPRSVASGSRFPFPPWSCPPSSPRACVVCRVSCVVCVECSMWRRESTRAWRSSAGVSAGSTWPASCVRRGRASWCLSITRPSLATNTALPNTPRHAPRCDRTPHHRTPHTTHTTHDAHDTHQHRLWCAADPSADCGPVVVALSSQCRRVCQGVYPSPRAAHHAPLA
jgi:hypothetical protein